jgi:hypothetical protein
LLHGENDEIWIYFEQLSDESYNIFILDIRKQILILFMITITVLIGIFVGFKSQKLVQLAFKKVFNELIESSEHNKWYTREIVHEKKSKI